MVKLKRRFIIITLIILALTPLINQKVFAKNTASLIKKVEYSDTYKKWRELPEEERKYIITPRMYDVSVTSKTSKNPLYMARMLGATTSTSFTLKSVIPKNLTIKNQENTNSCWVFAALSSLETNLAMSDYKNNLNTSKVYDFSERHMEYATSKVFANNVQNEKGYNRTVGSGGQWYMAETYLTNGMGAVKEADMPFENNESTINISKIQNKTIATQLYDTVDFPDYGKETGTTRTEIINQVKQHIQNYGSVYASLHGNSYSELGHDCYNNTTAAKYCKTTEGHGANHAVSIIGWNDNYDKNNFAEDSRPTSNGAWIIRNSWGTVKEYEITELKEEIFNTYRDACIKIGWTKATDIPNDFLVQSGYTLSNGKATMNIGDNGFMYVSYEDCNISTNLYGIVKATDTVDYDNIYQYDEYYPGYMLSLADSKAIICNTFNKKSTGTEYLKQVAIYAPETYTCKVYVNPNGTSKSKQDLKAVNLKSGTSKTIGSGYHTLELEEPIEIKSNNFAVAVEIQSTQTDSTKFMLETKIDDMEEFNSVKVESGKCFITAGNDLTSAEWIDLGTLSQVAEGAPNGDSTIKAFTVSDIVDHSLKEIKIEKEPDKKAYIVGQNFDKTGMIVKAYYNDGTSSTIDSSNYTITNGTSLKVGQTSVTITYEGKSVNQGITVQANSITSLEIKSQPNKKAYVEGQNFDETGLVVQAVYADGNKVTITNYEVTNGNNLKNNQTSVTVKYQGVTVQIPITVTPNELIRIEIQKEPNKKTYIVGQDFDKTGMIVRGIYADGSTPGITDYTIENDKNLSKEQTYVTIKYEGKTVTQRITVEEKEVIRNNNRNKTIKINICTK